MRTYSEHEQVPAAVITLATQESNKQHIIFQTRYDVKGYYTPEGKTFEETKPADNANCPAKLEWAIKAVTVSLFRDWSQSGARVTLACNLKNADDELPRLPKVDIFRGGQYPYLTIDDEIRIYAGYVSSPFEDMDANMLDDVPISVIEPEYEDNAEDDKGLTIKGYKKSEGIEQPNYVSGKLVPIFWGFIDKIDYDGNSRGGGHQVILSLRDRTRVLSDTTIMNIPSLNGVFGASGSTTLPQGRLSQIASDVARSVNGFQINIACSDQKNLNCWKTIITHPESRTKDTDCGLNEDDLDTASTLVEYYSAYDIANQGRVSSLGREVTRDPSLFVRRSSFKIMDVKSRPRFHMWLSRPPLAKNNGTSQWQILDQPPLKIIKWIAAKEERSMDFFASHVNGDFCLVPRVLDTSGLEDEQRMYRTYFFKGYPKSVLSEPPCKTQVVINLRSYTSIVGTFNRFTVVDNSNTSGAGLSVLEGVKVSIDRVPYILDGNEKDGTLRKPSPPCRQKIIQDGSLGTYSNSFGGALIVAQSVSAQLARDASGVEMTVLGDPTFYPGEAVRVYNTFLHDEGFQSQTGLYQDIIDKETAIDEFNKKWSSSNPNSAGIAGLGKNEKAVLSDATDSQRTKEVQEVGTMLTDINKLKLATYKIRNIEHVISTVGKNAGFTTKIACSMDINN